MTVKNYEQTPWDGCGKCGTVATTIWDGENWTCISCRHEQPDVDPFANQPIPDFYMRRMPDAGCRTPE